MQQIMQDEADNLWEVDAQGNPVRLVQQGGAPQMPAEPAFQYEGPTAAAQARKAQADAALVSAELPYAGQIAGADARKAEADARIAEAQAAAQASGKAQQTADTRKAALKGFDDTVLLDNAIRELERLYQAGPGSTSGVKGLQDFIGSPAMKDFDNAGNSLRAFVKGVLQFTGQENNTPQEAQMNFGPYIPQSSEWDGNILSKIERLKALRDSGYQRAVRALGGVPGPRGEIIPIPGGVPVTAENIAQIANGSPAPKYDLTNPTGPQAGGGMTAGQAGEKFQTERDREIGVSINRMIANGASFEEINAALEAFGRGRLDIPSAEEFERRKAMGNLSFVPQPTGVRTQEQETLGAVAMNPAFAAASGLADATSLGMMRALNPESMAAVEAENPMSALGGQIVGTAVGTGLIGAAGRNTIGRALPRLMSDSARARFGRNLAADVTYGAGYGANTEGDPLSGALAAGIGSVGGQALGKGLGAVAGGVALSPAVQRLRDAGVRMTAGRMLGPNASRVEDAMQSWPIVGDVIRNRQTESFEDFNRAAFEQAGRPIGFRPEGVGESGVNDFGNAVSDAYTQAVAGRQFQPDQQFFDDLTGVYQQRQQLPDDIGGRFDRLMDNHTMGLDVKNGAPITGDQYQRAMIALKEARGGAKQIAGGDFAQPYREVASRAMDAFRSLAERQGGSDVVQGLRSADQAYSNLKILEDAALDRAKVGTQTGAVEVFTPSQLIAAARRSQKKYGDNALKDLGRAGQEVLPSTLPNSGSTDRALVAGLGLGALGIGGAGEYAATGGFSDQGGGSFDNTAKIAAALALLTAGGTKGGQKVLTGILDPSNRPAAIGNARNALRARRKSGSALFGNTGVALALQ